MKDKKFHQIKGGKEKWIIQDIMGHANIQTTMDIYAEVTEEKKQEVVNSLQGKTILK